VSLHVCAAPLSIHLSPLPCQGTSPPRAAALTRPITAAISMDGGNSIGYVRTYVRMYGKVSQKAAGKEIGHSIYRQQSSKATNPQSHKGKRKRKRKKNSRKNKSPYNAIVYEGERKKRKKMKTPNLNPNPNPNTRRHSLHPLGLPSLNLHGLEVGRDPERGVGLGRDLVDRDALGVLDQRQTGLGVDVEHGEFGDDAADAGAAGQGEYAFYRCCGCFRVSFGCARDGVKGEEGYASGSWGCLCGRCAPSSRRPWSSPDWTRGPSRPPCP